jgi:DnaK suppressor protein
MDELSQFLRAELVRLQGSLRSISQENRTAEKPGLADISAHAAATLHAEIQVTLVDRRTQQMLQIEGALQRLAEGQYGFCQECDQFVGLARLRALPFAQRCRECQGRAEQRAGRETMTVRGIPPELEAA